MYILDNNWYKSEREYERNFNESEQPKAFLFFLTIGLPGCPVLASQWHTIIDKKRTKGIKMVMIIDKKRTKGTKMMMVIMERNELLHMLHS